ncbi:DUF2690 domain-containing protein [Streptomyces sp. LN549]|uniref:DUF2690 domain-containing protein n=1 Tax=Streptomyces sp. LN549 TaxID=3112979 RepID=UPI00371212F4
MSDKQETVVYEEQEPASARAELGMLLARWRGECGLSQARLAEKVYSNQPTVSRWEKGQLLPSREAIEAAWRVRSESERARPATVEELRHALLLHQRAEGGPRTPNPPAPTEPVQVQAGAGASAEAQQVRQTQRGMRMWMAVAAVCVVASAVVGVWLWGAGDDESAQAGAPGPTASAGLTPTVAATATCSAASCTSLDPATTICSKDAVTVFVGRKYGAVVELRYSRHCRAAWAKMNHTSPGDRILITPTNAGPDSTEEYQQRWGINAHTRMAPVNDPADAQACARIQGRGTICATTAVTGTAGSSPH